MRTELELIEKIEKYLSNELSADDKKAFEEQLAADPSLQEQVKLQQETMSGIERASLRKQVTDAGNRFRWRRNLRNWGLGGIVVLMVIAAVLLYKFLNEHSHNRTDLNIPGNSEMVDSLQLPLLNETGDSVWAPADSILPAQVFLLNAAKDTIVETKAGIVLSVPENGFLYANGSVAQGTIQLIVKEALDAASIVTAGLSTMSGERTLETGGMFLIDARQGKEILKINPANAIYAAVPSDTIKPGMMLFKGERNAKGNIDWKNPVPITNSLVTVDIQSLNFYPPGYLDSLKSWGYNIMDKKFTDSLYYSFAEVFQPLPTADTVSTVVSAPKDEYYVSPTDTIDYVGDFQQDIIYLSHCAINPASVKAFWNKKFQNTFVATRQFEERLKYIHLSGDQQILDAYIGNLDKGLSYIDSLVVHRIMKERHYLLVPKFQEFAARRDGNVMGGSRNAAKLADYFRRKTKAYTDAISKAQRAFWNKQAALDADFYNKQLSFRKDSIKRINENFQEEYALNLKEAYRQLDIKRYTFPVTSTGWNNIDRYVFESVENQTTLNYRDPVTGKKAVISFESVSFRIEDASSFERLSVYLLSDKLSSFIRLKEIDFVHSGKLNELMKYNMAVVGYKNGQPYFYSMNDVQSKEYSGIQLAPITEKELRQKLNALSLNNQAGELGKEQEFFRFEIQDRKRQKENMSRVRLRQNVIRVVFFDCFVDRK